MPLAHIVQANHGSSLQPVCNETGHHLFNFFFLVIIFNSQLKIPALFAAALASCLIGFLFVGLVNVLSWLALRRWHDSYRQDERT